MTNLMEGVRTRAGRPVRKGRPRRTRTMRSDKDPEGAATEDALVISDGAGNLYIIQEQTLKAGRVFDEIRERVDQLIAGLDASVGSHGPYRVVQTIRNSLLES
jgi:hypothetical protein